MWRIVIRQEPCVVATDATEPPSPARASSPRAKSSLSARKCAIGVVSRKRRRAICNAVALTPAAEAISASPMALGFMIVAHGAGKSRPDRAETNLPFPMQHIQANPESMILTQRP